VFKKLTILLLAVIIIFQTMAPTAVLANEYFYEVEETVADYEILYETEEVPEYEKSYEVEEEKTVYGEVSYEVDDTDLELEDILDALVSNDWTDEQWEEWHAFLDEIFVLGHGIWDLLSTLGLFEFDHELWDLTYGLWNLTYLPFEEAIATLLANIEALEDLEIRVRATIGWTPEQIDAWFGVRSANSNAYFLANSLSNDALDVLSVSEISEGLRSELEALINSFWNLSDERWSILNIVGNDALSFEEAALLMAANTTGFEDLILSFEAALDGVEVPVRYDWTEEQWDNWWNLIDESFMIEDRIWNLLSTFGLFEFEHELWDLNAEIGQLTNNINNLLPFEEANAALLTSIEALEDLETRVKATIGWTPEQIEVWKGLINDNNDAFDRASILAQKAITVLSVLEISEDLRSELEALIDKFFDLNDEFGDIVVAVWEGLLSFEEAAPLMVANTNGFEELVLSFEAALSDIERFDWTDEQWDNWWDLIDDNDDAFNRVWIFVQKASDVLLVSEISEDLRSELAALIDRLFDLDHQFENILTAVNAGLISFEDAASLMVANTNNFEELILSFETALDGVEIPIRHDWTDEQWDNWGNLIAEIFVIEDRIWSLFGDAGWFFDLYTLENEFWDLMNEFWELEMTNSFLPFEEAIAALLANIEALEDLEIRIREAIALDGWTSEQISEFLALIRENQFASWRVEDLLFFGEGIFDIDAYLLEFSDLVDAFMDLRNEVLTSNLSFENASARLIENTVALEDLASRLEALGIEILPPFDSWTDEQIDAWFILLGGNANTLDLIWELLMPDEVHDADFNWEDFDWDAHWDKIEELFGDLLDEFWVLLIEGNQIRNDAVRSRLIFEDAVILLVENTDALADLFERLNAAIAPVPVLHTITFNPTGGIVNPATMQTQEDGTLASLPTPTRAGYTFLGWFTEETGGEQVTLTTVFDADATVYAQWKTMTPVPVLHTITFNPTGGTVNPTTMQTQEDGTLASLPTPTRAGYTFLGWFTAEAGGEQVTLTTVFDANATVYAQWRVVGSDAGPDAGPGAGPSLPQTGAAIVSMSFAGVSLLGMGVFTAYFKNKKKQ